jgi:beta-lactamase regulating signal transducer with metallopeptidase domain
VSGPLLPDPVAALSWLWTSYVVALHATAFLAGVAVLAAAVGHASARARVWSLALPGLLAVTVLCYLPGGWGASLVPAGAAAPMLELRALAVAAEGGAADLRWAAWAPAAWMLGAALVLARVARGWMAARALTRGAEPVKDTEWLRLLREAERALGVSEPVGLRRSAAVATPLTWGVADPVILLPADADDWPPEHRRAVLLHELAHVRRGDCGVQLLGHLACAWYWFHPGAWWAAARLRTAREEACDAEVLRAGVRPSDYAECLMRLAEPARPDGGARAAAVSLGMARGSRLRGRLLRVLDPARRSAAGSRRAAVARLAVAAWILVLGTVRLGVHEPLVWDALRSGRPEMRAMAVHYLLAVADDPAAREAVRARAAADPHPVVRRAGAAGLR